jgi:hypothetical protein
LFVQDYLGYRLPISRDDDSFSCGYTIQDLVHMATSPGGSYDLRLFHPAFLLENRREPFLEKLLVIELIACPRHNVISRTLAKLRQKLLANRFSTGIRVVCGYKASDRISVTRDVIDSALSNPAQECGKLPVRFGSRNNLDHDVPSKK